MANATEHTGLETGDRPSSEHAALRYTTEHGFREQVEVVAQETPVTIYINGEEFATVVCSPWDIDNMTVGFLCSEGILRSREALGDMLIDEQKGTAHFTIEGYEQNIAGKVFLKRYINSCCGRSRASFYYSTDALLCKDIDAQFGIEPEMVLQLAHRLETESKHFAETGGVHSGILAQGADTGDVAAGTLLAFQEDIGRNNVLDRLYGKAFLEGIDLSDKVVAFTGRVSSEIVLKISKMGVPVLISRAAPTNLGLKLADELGITVCGFARAGRFNAYTHTDRLR